MARTIFCLTMLLLALGVVRLVPAENDAWIRAKVTEPRIADKRNPIPQKGALLVARRDMADPRFRQTVIFLVHYDDNGAFGLIANRPTALRLGDAVPDLADLDTEGHRLYFGGPVATDELKLLLRTDQAVSDAVEILKGLYASASHETLEVLLSGNQSAKDLRIYFGYAGWAPGQLDAELSAGAWFLQPAEIDLLFSEKPESIWPDLIDMLQPIGIQAESILRSCLEKTQASTRQGRKWRKSAVYKGVNEHFEPILNAGLRCIRDLRQLLSCQGSELNGDRRHCKELS